MAHYTPRRVFSILFTSLCLVAPPALHAQEAGEVSAFAGGSFGIGAHPMVGASAGTFISRYGLAVIETAFQPIGTHTIQPWPSRSAIDNSLLWDFSFCGHIRLRTTGRIQPYAIIGAGLLWDFIRKNGVDAYGNHAILHYDQANAALETGGGVRYYVGEEWGIRSEVKVIVNKDTYMRVSMGIFRELPTWWP